MPWYSILTVAAVVLVVVAELLWIRSGVFRRSAFWIALGICALFQIPVDGWLTKLSSPIVLYNSEVFSDVRVFWDSPVEDWGFGFALMTLALALWVRQSDDERTSAGAVDHAAVDGRTDG